MFKGFAVKSYTDHLVHKSSRKEKVKLYTKPKSQVVYKTVKSFNKEFRFEWKTESIFKITLIIVYS